MSEVYPDSLGDIIEEKDKEIAVLKKVLDLILEDFFITNSINLPSSSALIRQANKYWWYGSGLKNKEDIMNIFLAKAEKALKRQVRSK